MASAAGSLTARLACRLPARYIRRKANIRTFYWVFVVLSLVSNHPRRSLTNNSKYKNAQINRRKLYILTQCVVTGEIIINCKKNQWRIPNGSCCTEGKNCTDTSCKSWLSPEIKWKLFGISILLLNRVIDTNGRFSTTFWQVEILGSWLNRRRRTLKADYISR